jgi:hypothetical protein
MPVDATITDLLNDDDDDNDIMTALDRIESACTMTTEGSILWLRMTVLGSDR